MRSCWATIPVRSWLGAAATHWEVGTDNSTEPTPHSGPMKKLLSSMQLPLAGFTGVALSAHPLPADVGIWICVQSAVA